MNMQLDIQNFYERCFPNEPEFRSIDGIIITGACRIRKVLTMRSQVPDAMGNWIAREYGDEAAQEYEQRFLANEGSYGAPQQEDLP